MIKTDKSITAQSLGWFSLTQTTNSICHGVMSLVIYIHSFSCVGH